MTDTMLIVSQAKGALDRPPVVGIRTGHPLLSSRGGDGAATQVKVRLRRQSGERYYSIRKLTGNKGGSGLQMVLWFSAKRFTVLSVACLRASVKS